MLNCSTQLLNCSEGERYCSTVQKRRALLLNCSEGERYCSTVQKASATVQLFRRRALLFNCSQKASATAQLFRKGERYCSTVQECEIGGNLAKSARFTNKKGGFGEILKDSLQILSEKKQRRRNRRNDQIPQIYHEKGNFLRTDRRTET